MFRLGDGLLFGMPSISLAGVSLNAVLGAGCRSGHLAIVPIVVQRRNFFLLNQRGTADFTFLALGQAGLRTGRLLAGNSDGVMSRLGDGFRPCCFTPCAGVGLDASISTGGFCGHFAFVPFMVGLWDGFALFEELVAILTIKIAGIALFGAGGFLLVYGSRVDVVVGVHLAHFFVVRIVALHMLPRPPIPLLPDTVPHLSFFVDAGGFGNGRPTVRIVIMAIGSLLTALWCVAVWRPIPIATAGVAFLFRHRGVCRKAADRNAGTQTQQQAQTCRKFPSSASHRVKPPLFP